MTSPAGRGQLGDARRAVQFAGRRIGRPDRSATGFGGQPVWFDADPPTEPLPVVSTAATAMMTWSPPGLPEAPEPASALTFSNALRTATALWTPNAPGEPRPPAVVRSAYRWWLAALGIGLAAVILSVVSAWHYHYRTGTSLAGGATVGGVLFEVLVLVAASFVVVRMLAGDDWARTVLALVGGAVSLLYALTALSQITFLTSAAAIFRTGVAVLQLMAAVAAGAGVRCMFLPGAGTHFDPPRQGE